jgi:hypothetical protein
MLLLVCSKLVLASKKEQFNCIAGGANGSSQGYDLPGKLGNPRVFPLWPDKAVSRRALSAFDPRYWALLIEDGKWGLRTSDSPATWLDKRPIRMI